MDDYSPEEKNLFLSQGLLGLGAGLLSGSFGHYGAFAPALGQGAQGFQQGYGNAMQSAFQLRQLKQQKALQDAQIGHYTAQNDLWKAQEEQRRQQMANEAFDQNLMLPQGTRPVGMPVGTGTVLSPQPVTPDQFGSYKTPTNAQDIHDVLPNLSADQENMVGNGQVVFSQGPNGQPGLKPAETISPNGNVLASDVGVDGKQSESALVLKQANYWKDLASRAKTKEYRDQFMQNYRENYGKYVDLVKQENTSDLYQTVPDAPGVLRKKNSDQFFLNGNPISAEKVQEISQANRNAGASKNITNVNSYLPASEAAQKDFIDKASKNYDSLRSAPAAINNFNQIRQLVPQSGTFVGSFGDKKAAIAQFFNNNFGTTIDPNGVASSKELQTRLFYQIMDNLKKMDAQPSELQQKLMMDALGNITTDPKAITRIVDVAEQTLRDKVDVHNKEAKSAIDRGVKFPFDPIIRLPEKYKGGQKSDALSPSEKAELESLRKRFGK